MLRFGVNVTSSDSWNSRLGFPAVKRIQKYSLKMACFSALKKVIEFSTWGILRHFIFIYKTTNWIPSRATSLQWFLQKRPRPRSDVNWRRIYLCYVIGLIFIGQENSVFQCQVLSFNFFSQSITEFNTPFYCVLLIRQRQR